MGVRIYAKLNKETMRFIRNEKQISFDYIERVTGYSKDKILLWEDENSDKYPTINQAKVLANCYRVPFAGLYMDKERINILHLPPMINKRTMLGSVDDNSAVNLAIIDLLNKREFYLETKEALDEAVPVFNLTIPNSSEVIEWADNIREYFSIDLTDQYKKASTRKFYLYLRERIESKGIFVQSFQKVDTNILRGLAIVDKSIPIIGINDDDRYPAKSFSMIHELVHIIKRVSAICNDMYSSNTSDNEEVFCNAVAGECLVPKEALFDQIKDIQDYSINTVDYLAKKFSVSSEVISRRLLDTGVCNKRWYNEITALLRRRYQADRENMKYEIAMGLRPNLKRNMPMEAIDRNSTFLCDALLKGYSEGLFDKADISAHIGIAQKHIGGFVSEVMRWYQ